MEVGVVLRLTMREVMTKTIVGTATGQAVNSNDVILMSFSCSLGLVFVFWSHFVDNFHEFLPHSCFFFFQLVVILFI